VFEVLRVHKIAILILKKTEALSLEKWRRRKSWGQTIGFERNPLQILGCRKFSSANDDL